MAEINTGEGQSRARKGRNNKLSTKVDLTPMVDLGFLLITFFIVTTAWTKPRTMSLYMPAGNTPDMAVKRSTVLTIIPITKDKVFYYHGDFTDAMQHNQYGITNFSITGGIGNIIRQKQVMLDAVPKLSRNDLMLIIKPATGASYESIADALDEVLINNLKHYSLVDMGEPEKTLLKSMQINN